MVTLMKSILALLGLGGGAGLVNTIGGIANHAAAPAAITWALKEPDGEINIKLSRLALLVVVALFWFVLETMRRSRPHNPFERD